MAKKLIFILFVLIIPVALCAGERYNKSLLFFNYTTNELCLLNIDTGIITKRLKMDLNITQLYISDEGFSFRWFFDNIGNNLFLRKIDRRRNTKVYKIDIETFKLTEVFNSETFFSNIFARDNNLYLMNYISSFQRAGNKEDIFILKHDLSNQNETIINFNKTLPKDKQLYVRNFFVKDNKILMFGFIDNSALSKLYLYDMVLGTIDVLDYYVSFGIRYSNGLVLYMRRITSEIFEENILVGLMVYGHELVFYNFGTNKKTVLPYEISPLQDFIILDQNTIIFSKEDESTKPYFDPTRDIYTWVSWRDRKRLMNFYIANVNQNNKKRLFSSYDRLEMIGIVNEIQGANTAHNKR